MRDYFTFTEQPSIKDISLLKLGRHFRLESGDKVIVARNEHECNMLKKLCPARDHLLFPRLSNIKNGCYEIQNGQAYKVNFLGITKKLNKDHPLNQFSIEKTKILYNITRISVS